MTTYTQDELNEKIRARFQELPEVIQKAITSADVQKQLRQLADTKKLHLDQWQLLENNVMLTLLGFQPPEELAENLKEDLVVSGETANQLAADISRIVFEPIRQELERELEHPEAKTATSDELQATRQKILDQERASDTDGAASSVELRASSQSVPESAAATSSSSPLAARSSVIPATPPPLPPTERAVRAPTSSSYKSGETSIVRKDVHEDPYREPPA